MDQETKDLLKQIAASLATIELAVKVLANANQQGNAYPGGTTVYFPTGITPVAKWDDGIALDPSGRPRL